MPGYPLEKAILLLPLSHFSRVRLCATPSLGFSRQEHWSGLPFPSPMHNSEKWKWNRCHVRLFATPWTAAYQAPPSMGFSRRECWSGVPLPSPEKAIGRACLLTGFKTFSMAQAEGGSKFRSLWKDAIKSVGWGFSSNWLVETNNSEIIMRQKVRRVCVWSFHW